MILYLAYSEAGQFIESMCQIWLLYVNQRKRYVSTLSYFWLTLVLGYFSSVWTSIWTNGNMCLSFIDKVIDKKT